MSNLPFALFTGGAGGPPPTPSAQAWNPADKSANITLSAADLVATRGAAADNYYSVIALNSGTGKRYWEIELTTFASGIFSLLGVDDVDPNDVVFGIGGPSGWGYAPAEGVIYHNNAQVVTVLTGASPGDVLSFALDYSTGKMWFGRNGGWMSGGDPAAGTGQQVTVSGTMKPAASLYRNGYVITLRTSDADFDFAPPSGFSAFP